MGEVMLAGSVALVVIVGSWLVGRARRRRSPEPPSAVGAIPAHVPQAAFAQSQQAVRSTCAVVVFTEATCQSCAAALQLARAVAGERRTVVEIEYGARRDLHAQLGIDAVPTTVVVLPDGAVTAGFVGRVPAEALAAALADADQTTRNSGSTPPSTSHTP